MAPATAELTYGFLSGASVVLIVVAALFDAASELGLMDPLPVTPLILAAGGVLALIGAL